MNFVLTFSKCAFASLIRRTFVSATSCLSSLNSAISLDRASTTNSSSFWKFSAITFWSACNSLISDLSLSNTKPFNFAESSFIAIAYLAFCSANCLRSSANSAISACNFSLTIASMASTICALSCSYFFANSSRSSDVTACLFSSTLVFQADSISALISSEIALFSKSDFSASNIYFLLLFESADYINQRLF